MSTAHGAADRRVMVVGSWAKEQIILEDLERVPEVTPYAYMDTHNPGIAAIAAGHRIGSLSDPDPIVGYARDVGADLVMITTAAPLAAGAADSLAEAGVPVFGPRRKAARLEWDKAFQRDLLEEARIDAAPTYRVLDSATEAETFAAELDWEVAVKPIGLTDGLGVRVAGDHLRNRAAVREAIAEILDGHLGNDRRVLIERRLHGEEFTVQYLVHGDAVVAMPPVQDFKRLEPEDQGPNTGSMGSYSCADGGLPFLTAEDLAAADGIVRAALAALREREGVGYTGFLYGQFMRTAAGVRLIEFNVRPGDPEWLNTMTVLEDPLLDLVDAVMRGEEVRPRLRPRASVCLYVAPEDYPAQKDCALDVEVDVVALARTGASLYHSCGLVDGRLRVGSERGLAVVADGDDVPAARERALAAVDSAIHGAFNHRPDIGSPTMVHAKRGRGDVLHALEPVIRPFREEDAEAVAHLLQVSPPLEAYPLHLLLIAQRCFGRTCWVAEVEREIVGWLMGLGRDRSPRTWFLWQIGVRPSTARRGVARRLLEHGDQQLAEAGFHRVEVTVDPSNEASLALFEASGYERRSDLPGFSDDAPGLVRHHYGPGRHFVLLEKTLPMADPSSPDPDHRPYETLRMV